MLLGASLSWYCEGDVTYFCFFFQYETRKQGEVVLEGSNASAEELDEGTDEGTESGIDIVLNHRLVETGFPDKKAFTDYLKSYMKKVIKFLEENNRAGEVDGFKTNISKVSFVGRFNLMFNVAFYFFKWMFWTLFDFEMIIFLSSCS